MRTPATRRALCGLTLLVLGTLALPARAGAADVVVLSSGNRLTGSLVGLSRGRLGFSIAGAGRVDIAWRNVVSLECERPLDVELVTGERLSGSITTPAERRLEVRGGGGTRTVVMDDVVRLTPIGATVAERTSGAVDAGVDFLRANDEIDLTLNAEAEHRTRHYLTELSYSALLRRRDGGTAQSRNHAELGTRRFLRDRWFALGRLAAEEDHELDLDLRVLVAAALGRSLVQANGVVLAVFGGLDYDLERYGPVPGTDHYAEALAGVEWEWFEVGGATTLALDATTYASLGRARARLDLDGSLRRDLVRSFYVRVGVFGAFDSDPPAGLETSDYGLSVGFGRSF